MTNLKAIRIYVEQGLLDEVKKDYPEAKGMTYTGLVDWALRYLLKPKEEASS